MMTPSRPYLVRAIYEWLVDNNSTPYLLIDATNPLVRVPPQHIKDGKIVLNAAPHAVKDFFRCFRAASRKDLEIFWFKGFAFCFKLFI